MSFIPNSFSVESIRNHTDFECCFLRRNIDLIGSNGSGKSTLLESLYFIINGLPISGKRARDYLHYELKKDGAINFSVRNTILESNQIWRIAILATEKKVILLHNGEKISREAYLQSMPFQAFLISPHHLRILYGEPSLRRDWFDQFLQLAFPSFFGIQKAYFQTLKSRNAQLREIKQKKYSIDSLDIWDNLLIKYGSQYEEYRNVLVQFLDSILPNIQLFIQNEYPLVFQYNSLTDPLLYEERLLSSREKDIHLGYTSFGPQSNDFIFQVCLPVGTLSAGDFYSRGEMMSLLIALFSQCFQFVINRTKKTPILLLDDMFSELDTKHKHFMIENFSSYWNCKTHVSALLEEDEGLQIINL